MKTAKWLRLAGLFGALVLFAGGARADTFTPISSAALPNGTVVESYAFTLDPGVHTGFHYHQGRVWVTVLAGELTEVRGCGVPVEVHHAGEVFSEEPGVIHDVYTSSTGAANVSVIGLGPSCTADFNDLVAVDAPLCDEDGEPDRVEGPFCPPLPKKSL